MEENVNDDLFALAAIMGVRIIETDRLDPRWNGQFSARHRAIVVRRSLDPWTKRSCIAHELGHAHYGDEQHGDPRAERRADRFAAQLLISEKAMRDAENITGPETGALAHHLGVTPNLIEVWKENYKAKIHAR